MSGSVQYFRVFWCVISAAMLCAPGAVAQSAAIEPVAGDAQRGRIQFLKCRSCHTLKPGEAHLVGPNLSDIIGAPSAAKEDFAYSNAMQDVDIVWSDEVLEGFIERPQNVVPGTTMVFIGLKNEGQRRDLIAYIKQNTVD